MDISKYLERELSLIKKELAFENTLDFNEFFLGSAYGPYKSFKDLKGLSAIITPKETL